MKWINLAFLHVYVHRSLFSNFPNLPLAPPLAAVRIWKQYNGSLRGRQINFWTGVGCGLGLRTAPGQSRTQIFFHVPENPTLPVGFSNVPAVFGCLRLPKGWNSWTGCPPAGWRASHLGPDVRASVCVPPGRRGVGV